MGRPTTADAYNFSYYAYDRGGAIPPGYRPYVFKDGMVANIVDSYNGGAENLIARPSKCILLFRMLDIFCAMPGAFRLGNILYFIY